MINLNDKLSLEGYGLLLLNDVLTITKTIKSLTGFSVEWRYKG